MNKIVPTWGIHLPWQLYNECQVQFKPINLRYISQANQVVIMLQLVNCFTNSKISSTVLVNCNFDTVDNTFSWSVAQNSLQCGLLLHPQHPLPGYCTLRNKSLNECRNYPSNKFQFQSSQSHTVPRIFCLYFARNKSLLLGACFFAIFFLLKVFSILIQRISFSFESVKYNFMIFLAGR